MYRQLAAVLFVAQWVPGVLLACACPVSRSNLVGCGSLAPPPPPPVPTCGRLLIWLLVLALVGGPLSTSSGQPPHHEFQEFMHRCCARRPSPRWNYLPCIFDTGVRAAVSSTAGSCSSRWAIVHAVYPASPSRVSRIRAPTLCLASSSSPELCPLFLTATCGRLFL